jgi:glycosylphosphatidylinositol transamidase (GPIT) subunit GPI8
MSNQSSIPDQANVEAVTAGLLVALLGSMAEAKSKDKSKKTDEERAVGIYLIGHTPLSEITVNDIAPVAKPDRQLIQLTDNVHGKITLLDVGDPQKPTPA